MKMRKRAPLAILAFMMLFSFSSCDLDEIKDIVDSQGYDQADAEIAAIVTVGLSEAICYSNGEPNEHEWYEEFGDIRIACQYADGYASNFTGFMDVIRGISDGTLSSTSYYDSDGVLSKVTYYFTSGCPGTIPYYYSGIGDDSGLLLEDYYDADGNISKHVLYMSASFIYSIEYDTENNTTTYTNWGVVDRIDTYDTDGNLATSTYRHKTSYYDAEGDLSVENYYDSEGNLFAVTSYDTGDDVRAHLQMTNLRSRKNSHWARAQ